MSEPVDVPVGTHARHSRVDAALDESARLIEHAAPDHVAHAGLDARYEPVARRVEADAQRRDGGVAAPAAAHPTGDERRLEIPNDTPHVAWIDARGRVGIRVCETRV